MSKASGLVRNRIRKRVALSVIGAYGYILWHALLLSPALALGLAVYSALMIWAAHVMFVKELTQHESGVSIFRQHSAFGELGTPLLEFQHIFSSTDILLEEVEAEIETQLTSRTSAGRFEHLVITDIDPEIQRKDTRKFLASDAGHTSRGSHVRLILQTGAFGKVQSVQWWVFVRGFIDRSRLLIFLALAPAHVPFIILPYLTRSTKVTPFARVTYGGSYNSLDVVQLVRSLHYVVMEALVDLLDAKGIDTSDLKLQRAQVLNINVSGGKVGFGNIVQGAANRISAATRRVKAA
jgi:hypothetical protein